MIVLVVNAGSSTLKCQLIQTDGKIRLMKSLAERIGDADAAMEVAFAPNFQKRAYPVPGLTVEQCLGRLLDLLAADPESPISSLSEIQAVGNRIVAGGEYFSESVLVDGDVFQKLLRCEELAPLHNPHADACIKLVEQRLPGVPQSAVFDTAFHQTMPPKAYMYPLPMHYYTDEGIRRYGAHGTSHRYAAQQAANLLNRPLEDLGLITCHLGSGGSITAVNHGHSIDTTMGFTPLEGLMMGTRSGSIDPAIVTYIMRRDGLSFDEMDAILNKESGILGISGISSDMRTVLQAAEGGNENAELAVEMYVYKVQKAIGSFYAAMTQDRCRGDDGGHRRELGPAARAHLRWPGAHGHDLGQREEPGGGRHRHEPHREHRRQPHQNLRGHHRRGDAHSPRNRRAGGGCARVTVRQW